MKELKTVEEDLKETIRIIREAFGEGYAVKNPGLVQFFMEKIQQERDRALNRAVNKLT